MLLTSHELNMQQAIPNPSRTKKHQQFSNSEKEEMWQQLGWQQVLPCHHEARSREAAGRPSTSSQRSSSD